MAEVISAKCSGCGHVVKVPASLGGKKARCPRCPQVITIPTQPDPGSDFIPDDQLPEVARDEDILQGLPVEEDEIVEGEPVEERPVSSSRLRSMTPRRGSPVADRGGRARASGTHQRIAPHGGHTASPRSSSSSSTPLIIGVILAVVVAGVVAAVMLMAPKPDGKKGTPGGDKAAPPPVSPVTDADLALQRRCLEYVSTFNKGNVLDIMKFYSYEPSEEQKLKAAISALLEQGTRYDDVGFKDTSAAGGTLTFSHAKGERKMTWKQVEGVWLIADKP